MIDRDRVIQIFKASPVPTSILRVDDPTFTCIQVNDAYEQLFTRSVDELIGKSVFASFPSNPAEAKPHGSSLLLKSFQKVISTKQADELDSIRYDILNGENDFKEVYWKVMNVPVFDDSGEVEFIINSATDVTQHVLSQRANKLMLDNSEDSFIFANRNFEIESFNDRFDKNYREIFGIEVKAGDNILDYAKSEQRELVREIHARVFKGETVKRELSFEAKDGETRYFSLKYKPAEDEKGQIIGSFTSVLEKTDEQKAILDLEKNEARYRALVENGNDVLFILNTDGSPKYVSPSIKNVLGFTQKEALELDMIANVHPDDIEQMMVEIQKCLEQPGVPMNPPPARLKDKQGNWRWFEGTITNMLHDPAIEGIVDNFQEITERIEANQIIAQAKDQFQSLIQSIDGIVWEADPETIVFNYVSPQVKEVLGYEPTEWAEVPGFWESKIHPDERKKVVEYCVHQTQKGQNHRIEYRMQKANGEYIWLRDIITVVLENGKPALLRGLMMDITVAKKAQEQLQKAQEKYRNVVEHSTNMFYQHDTEGILSYVSNQSIEFLGCQPEKVMGNWIQFVTDHPKNKIAESITAKAIETGKAQPPYEIQLRKMDGKLLWVEVHETPLKKNDEVIGIAGSLTDVTDRKNAEIKLEAAFKEKETLLESLMLSEKRFKALVQEGSDLIAILDEELKFSYVSPSVGDNFASYTGIKVIDLVHPEDSERVENSIKRLATERRILLPPYRLQDHKGHYYWVETILTNMLDEPAVQGYVANSRNITDQVNREEKLRELSLVASKTTDSVIITDAKGFITWINDAFVSLSGYRLDEVKGKKPGEFLQGEKTDPATIKRISTAIQHHRSIEETILNYNRQGEIYWLNINIDPIFDEQGICTHFIAIERDVTEKLNAEREIELSEKRFRSLIQDGSDLIAILDEQANYTYVSPTSEAVLGIKAEDFIGTNVIEYIHPDYQKIVQESLVALELEHRIELSPFKFKDSVGNWRWIETKVTNMLNNAAVKGYVANSRDVTEKIEKQKELKESLERYSIVSKATSDTIWDLDLETNTLQYNNNLFSMFGYNKTKIGNIEHWWHKKIHPDDLKIVQKAITDVVKTGKERFNIEYRVKAADGTYKHVFNRAFVIKDENGKATRMIGAMQDVSQGVEEEERLKLLESVITNTAESVVITEAVPEELPGRKILYVNEAFSKQTGYEKSEVIGKTLSFLNGPETDQNTRKKLRASMENYETTEVDFINYKKNGEKFWNTISMVPVSNKEGKYTHWVAIGRDTTDQKQYEDEIKKSLLEKNTLLAEIHHRVKNNLAVVSGLMQLQAFETENEDLQAKLYDSVVRIRTMATVHELLYQSGSFSQLEFSDTLKKLVQNVSDTLQSANEIKVDIDCDPVILNINQAIPASLIVNEVITNAYKHAFKGCEKGEIKFKLSETNNQIHIEIKDNGVGLPDDFIQNNSTLGFHLIQILCQQINGEYSFNNSEKATTFLLEFSKTEIGVGGIPNN